MEKSSWKTALDLLPVLFLSCSLAACSLSNDEEGPSENGPVEVEFSIFWVNAPTGTPTVDLTGGKSVMFVLEDMIKGGKSQQIILDRVDGQDATSHSFSVDVLQPYFAFWIVVYQGFEGLGGILAESVGRVELGDEDKRSLNAVTTGPVHEVNIAVSRGGDNTLQAAVLPPTTYNASGELLLLYPDDVIWRTQDPSTAVVDKLLRNCKGYVTGISPGSAEVSVEIHGVTDSGRVGVERYSPTGLEKKLEGRWESPGSAWERFALQFDPLTPLIKEFRWEDGSPGQWVLVEDWGDDPNEYTPFTQDGSYAFITIDGVVQTAYSISTNDELEIDHSKGNMFKVE